MSTNTKEPQYESCLEIDRKIGRTRFGLMANLVWHDDPRRLGFLLARYKFAAKMLSGYQKVLEVGCADGFGTRVVQQEVPDVTVADFDPVFIADVNQRMEERWKLKALVHDFMVGPLEGDYDAVYAIDVIEHIPKESSPEFIGNMVRSLGSTGICILGSPSIQSQAYASAISKAGHVNCMDAMEMKVLMQRFFHNVFMFSMNDEVVHTGYSAMAHYIWAIGSTQR